MDKIVNVEGISLNELVIQNIKYMQDDPEFTKDHYIGVLDNVQKVVYLTGIEQCQAVISVEDTKAAMSLLYIIKDILRGFISPPVLEEFRKTNQK